MQWQRAATYRIAAALRSTDGQGKGKAKARRGRATFCEAKAEHGEAEQGMARHREAKAW
nr:MAG TPA: hypothetical protein [Caudoviricetes sp.]